MKQIINELYWEVMSELEKLHKSKMLLSERLAYEILVVKLETIKKLLNSSLVTLNQ